MTSQEKSEDRDPRNPEEDLSHINQGPIFASITTWLSKQSLPRLIGLLLGNTRDLEIHLGSRLLDKDKEIDYLKSLIKDWEERYTSLQDSMLLSRGMKSTSPSANGRYEDQSRQINTHIPGENLMIEAEIDRLKEIYLIRPGDLDEELKDIEAVPNPRNKLIVQRFCQWWQSTEESKEDQGVVIMQ